MEKITAAYELGSKSKQFLREQAELIVSEKVTLSAQNLEAMTPAATRELVHELQVHQIELEMQNETLRQTQLQLVAMQARYFDLYDLAPISYCTVNETGIILEANLATAELLGEARNSLVGQRISRYIRKEYQDSYYLSRKLLDTSGERQSCELHMVRADDSTFWVNASISAVKASNGDTLQRMVLTDITNAKVMAIAMRESEDRLRALVDSHSYASNL
jgi:PAS domain S-box-containing protein